MANQDGDLYAATTVLEDADLIFIRKASDGLWRKMSGAAFKATALDSLTVGGTGTFSDLSAVGKSALGAVNSQDSAVTINDDAAHSIAFSGDARGVAVITAGSITSGTAVVFFRVGTTPQCVVLSSNIASGSVVATTGALTGTDGTDGNMTISTHTDETLYIENRTGGAANYQVAFLAMQGADVSSL